jgi:hypothetical protein
MRPETSVGVEKLFPAKFAKIKSRQETLQTTFSVFLDIFYPPNFGYFEENGLFQHPQAITLKTPVAGSMSKSRFYANDLALAPSDSSSYPDVALDCCPWSGA